eukprot:6654255-Prymnesium_polylepis.1
MTPRLVPNRAAAPSKYATLSQRWHHRSQPNGHHRRPLPNMAGDRDRGAHDERGRRQRRGQAGGAAGGVGGRRHAAHLSAPS